MIIIRLIVSLVIYLNKASGYKIGILFVRLHEKVVNWFSQKWEYVVIILDMVSPKNWGFRSVVLIVYFH